jgi:transposase
MLDREIALAEPRRPERRPDAAQRAALKKKVDALKRRRDDDDAQQRRVIRREINALVAAEYHRRDGSAADTPSQRRERLKRITRHRANVQNLVREARDKIALDLVRRYDTLILPPFETGRMVKKNQDRGGRRKLHSKVARSLMSWSCYEFRIHVKRVFLRHGREVVEMGEEYTTMCCGCCGVLNEKHSNEEWTCKHCGSFHLRDPAAARCIFLKSLAAPQTAQSPEPTSCGEVQPTNISTTTLAVADDEVACSRGETLQ